MNMNKNTLLAEEIVKQVGGKANISNVFHCMTRLRFELKDSGLANIEEIKKINGVLGLNVDGNEYQVIIGPAVDDVYSEVLKMTDLERTEKLDEDLDHASGKNDNSLKGIWNRILGAFSGCMNPLVPTFVLLGMFNVVAALIGPNFLKLVTTDSNWYTNFYYVGQAIIYFLPVFIAISASKHFKCNTYLSVVLACVLLYPDLVTLMSAGTSYSVYGIPAAAATYSGTVIPIMLIVWIQSYVEKWVNRISPDNLKVVLVPFLTILIMLPLALCAFGPLGGYIGTALASAIMWLRQTAGPLETMLVAAFVPFMTAFGIGRPLFFVCLTTLLSTGSEYAYMPIAMVLNNWLSMAVAVGYAIKSKQPKDKQLGMTCFAANFLGGVSEPTLFGILLPNKKTYLPVIIGGAVSGLYLGIMNVGLFQFGTSNFLNVMGFVGGDSSANLINGLIATALAFGVTLAMMMIFYKDEKNPESK